VIILHVRHPYPQYIFTEKFDFTTTCPVSVKENSLTIEPPAPLYSLKRKKEKEKKIQTIRSASIKP
jgi:hypothetical protein